MRRPKMGVSDVGPLPCSKPRPETHTRDLGGGRAAIAAEQREGSDPASAAGETCTTRILFSLFHFCETFDFAISVPFVSALIDNCRENLEWHCQAKTLCPVIFLSISFSLRVLI